MGTTAQSCRLTKLLAHQVLQEVVMKTMLTYNPDVFHVAQDFIANWWLVKRHNAMSVSQDMFA